MTGRWIFAVLLVCLGFPAVASAQPEINASRGELLYAKHCVSCHDAKIHWRDRRVAKDMTGLNVQVRRWQGIAGLKWSDADIAEVARYLNTLHYHYPGHAE